MKIERNNILMGTLKSKLLIMLCFVFFTGSVFAQNARGTMDEVINAIKSNKVHDLSRYFDNFVPVTINNNPSNYSHNQAEIVLRDFLDKNPARDLIVTETGTPNNTSVFAIGNFRSGSGKYNLYVLLKLKDKTYLVKEIRINKE